MRPKKGSFTSVHSAFDLSNQVGVKPPPPGAHFFNQTTKKEKKDSFTSENGNLSFFEEASLLSNSKVPPPRYDSFTDIWNDLGSFTEIKTQKEEKQRLERQKLDKNKSTMRKIGTAFTSLMRIHKKESKPEKQKKKPRKPRGRNPEQLSQISESTLQTKASGKTSGKVSGQISGTINSGDGFYQLLMADEVKTPSVNPATQPPHRSRPRLNKNSSMIGNENSTTMSDDDLKSALAPSPSYLRKQRLEKTRVNTPFLL